MMSNTNSPSSSEDDLSGQFRAAINRFDEENSKDPNREIENGSPVPRELAHAKRLSDWVRRLCPEASEELRLAARCQHICRWSIPRTSYDMNRVGYLKWRADLKAFHAQKSGELLREVGYTEEKITRVQALNLKKGFPKNSECQVLEDALCLVFLEIQFSQLASKMPEEKMIQVLQKTWQKMSTPGRAEALKLSYGERESGLLEKAELTID